MEEMTCKELVQNVLINFSKDEYPEGLSVEKIVEDDTIAIIRDEEQDDGERIAVEDTQVGAILLNDPDNYDTIYK